MKIVKLEHLQFIFTAIIALSVISPPLANLFEFILVISMFFCGAVYERIKIYIQTVDFKIHASFICLLLIGIFYPLVDSQTYLSSILSWRKFLLLPIGYIIFLNCQSEKFKLLKYLLYFLFSLTVLGLIYKNGWLFFFNINTIKYQIGTTSSEAMFIAVALAIVLFSLLHKYQLSGISKKIEFGIALFLIAYIAMYTTGRSGYIAMLVVLIFMAIKYVKLQHHSFGIRAWVILSVVISLSVALLMNSKTSSDRIEQALVELQQTEKNLNENISTSIGQRVIFWNNTLQMVPQYYLFGAGTGAFQAAYTQQVANKTGLDGAVTQDPHNQYLKILIEQGILGLALFMTILFRALIQKNVQDEIYLLGSTIICIWIVTSCFNAHFSTFMEGTFIWAWLGLMNRYKKMS